MFGHSGAVAADAAVNAGKQLLEDWCRPNFDFDGGLRVQASAVEGVSDRGQGHGVGHVAVKSHPKKALYQRICGLFKALSGLGAGLWCIASVCAADVAAEHGRSLAAVAGALASRRALHAAALECGADLAAVGRLHRVTAHNRFGGHVVILSPSSRRAQVA
ncbi:hypothetical protein AU198_11660 [Mycobacterium sp. GA-1199]|nr:hypothetical protein AU198_11660 [Mycobacterium sp. GA-1199]